MKSIRNDRSQDLIGQSDAKPARNRFRSLLLAGLAGGALGGLALSAAPFVINLDKLGKNSAGGLLVVYLVFGLPFGAGIGAIVGTSIWLIQRLIAIDLGVVGSVLTGTIIAGVLWFFVFTSNYQPGYAETSWQSDLLGLFLFGVSTGGIPGYIVARRSTRILLKDT